MTRIAYTVSCDIVNEEKAAEWLAWLRGGHVQDVIAGGAQSAQIVRFDGGPPVTCEVRYVFPDRETYDEYIRDHAPRLREEGLKKFPPEAGFSYSRTVGAVIEE